MSHNKIDDFIKTTIISINIGSKTHKEKFQQGPKITLLLMKILGKYGELNKYFNEGMGVIENMDLRDLFNKLENARAQIQRNLYMKGEKIGPHSIPNRTLLMFTKKLKDMAEEAIKIDDGVFFWG